MPARKHLNVVGCCIIWVPGRTVLRVFVRVVPGTAAMHVQYIFLTFFWQPTFRPCWKNSVDTMSSAGCNAMVHVTTTFEPYGQDTGVVVRSIKAMCEPWQLTRLDDATTASFPQCGAFLYLPFVLWYLRLRNRILFLQWNLLINNAASQPHRPASQSNKKNPNQSIDRAVNQPID